MKFPISLLLTVLFFTTALLAQEPTTGSGFSDVKSLSILPEKGKEVQPSIYWSAPLGDNLQIESDSVEIQANFVLPHEIIREDITLLVNGEPLETKADEVDLFGDSAGNEFSFSQRIPLDWGVNQYVVTVQTKEERLFSPILVINKHSDQILSAGLKSIEDRQGAPLSIFWKKPNIYKLGGKPLPLDRNSVNIELSINSNVPIEKKDIRVVLNRVFIKNFDFAKFNRVAKNQYKFTMPIQIVKKGKNSIVVMVSAANGEIQSKPLELEYNITRPNLHVLTIGPDRDLKYTAKDAMDVGSLFAGMDRSSPHSLFNKINVEQLTGLRATTQAIRERIGFLYTQYESGLIQERDMVVVFISSHGFLWKGEELRIQGADYKSENRWATSISYEKDLISVLENMKCKKLILMDACHSGKGGSKDAASDVNAVIKKLNENRDAMTTIASSRGDEKSFEDDYWKNGAFTKAVKDALQGGNADTDGNKVITVRELFDYLKKNVPEMVFQIKQVAQTPIMINEELNDIAIYNLN